jgi:alpha-tubulin suppressor-like RCC1 family protein
MANRSWSQLPRAFLIAGGCLLLVLACASLRSSTVAGLKPRAISRARHAVAISVGDEHACAVLWEGTIQCWGDNSHGELGYVGVDKTGATPVSVAGITNALAVAAGSSDTCALLRDGTVRCWGSNLNGAFGKTPLNIVPAPIPIPGLTNATSIVNRGSHYCALLPGGTIECWGLNGSGELGNGTHVPLPYSDRPVPEPVAVIGITNATALAAGGVHTCALLRSGSVKCWGLNLAGELGIGKLGKPELCKGTWAASCSPVEVQGITNAVAIAANSEYSCALLKDATISCWGAFPLGTRRLPESSIPRPVLGITNAAAIAAGGGHICALLRGGTVKCWGINRRGQLGNGTVTDSEVPVAVKGLSSATSVSVGLDNSCALLNDGSIRCWGMNVSGNLGDGTTKDSSVPVAVLDLTVRPAHCEGGWPSLGMTPLPEGVVRQWFEARGLVPSEPLPTCFQKLAWPGEPNETLLCATHYFTSFGGQKFAEMLVGVLGVRDGLLGYWFLQGIAAGTATDASCGQYRAIDKLLVQLDLAVKADNQTFVIRDMPASACSDSLAELDRDAQRGTISLDVHSNWRSEVDNICRSRGVYPWRDGRFSEVY